MFGLGKWIDYPITGNDVRRYKPHPDGVFRALETAGIPPERGLVVRDSPKDIKAGRIAGTKTGIALWGVRDESQFDGLHADYGFQTPHQLLITVVSGNSSKASWE